MLKACIPYTDYLFGNEEEAVAVGEVYGFKDTTVTEVARELSKFPKFNLSRPRVVVFTQGSEPTVVAFSLFLPLFFPPTPTLLCPTPPSCRARRSQSTAR